MKKITLWAGLFALALTTAVAGAQSTDNNGRVKDDLFAGTEAFAKNATDATEVNMDPESLNMVNGKDQKRAHRMVLNVVRTYSYDKPGMYNMADVEVYRRKLDSGDWHCSVHTRNLKTGDSTDICSKARIDGMKETAIITISPKSLTFIHTIRKAGDDDSEFDTGMISPMDAARMAILEARLQAMPQFDQARVDALLQKMPKLDDAEMKRRMAEAEKKLQEAGKKMQNLNLPEPE